MERSPRHITRGKPTPIALCVYTHRVQRPSLGTFIFSFFGLPLVLTLKTRIYYCYKTIKPFSCWSCKRRKELSQSVLDSPLQGIPSLARETPTLPQGREQLGQQRPGTAHSSQGQLWHLSQDRSLGASPLSWGPQVQPQLLMTSGHV